jgi:hypothetical protein
MDSTILLLPGRLPSTNSGQITRHSEKAAAAENGIKTDKRAWSLFGVYLTLQQKIDRIARLKMPGLLRSS